ncbi:MAG TPA: hypothetical protein P5555_12300 [Candidatus Paceibacterota bacterium]|nr:hypothetical protein [Verrucomicrobiota bacterium]HOX03072.1 hypothetical protein [Verrucomicrobiota bacterium]HRZ45962.1 hypothetical protein [Candidatus Paceibacterota bacterium]HRZ92943.1 hypothetical protein [Candidatus Paceibacterota bacterium]
MNPLPPEPPNPIARSERESKLAWYAAVSRYEWLVLAIASAGWIFDAFEGQIFNITRNQLLGDILGLPSGAPAIQRYGDIFNGGRLLAAPVLVFSGWLKALPGVDLRLAITLLGLLFLLGIFFVGRLPETKDQPLPE